MSVVGCNNPKAERPKMLLPGLEWERDLAPWWSEEDIDVPTERLFRRSMYVWKTVRKEVDELNEFIYEEVQTEGKMSPMLKEATGFAGRTWRMAYQLVSVVAELTRRECVRLGRDEEENARLCRDMGTQTQERGGTSVDPDREGEGDACDSDSSAGGVGEQTRGDILGTGRQLGPAGASRKASREDGGWSSWKKGSGGPRGLWGGVPDGDRHGDRDRDGDGDGRHRDGQGKDGEGDKGEYGDMGKRGAEKKRGENEGGE
ncbi:oleosin-B4-like [Nylanderia fulva]|uniref:oleosin-B4-like n=1 Tax=Nylanderia fulva TaxID=613905 RepID=UPI0010FB4E36|nr:oleosin-B4-like [Nylanderia fulva]